MRRRGSGRDALLWCAELGVLSAAAAAAVAYVDVLDTGALLEALVRKTFLASDGDRHPRSQERDSYSFLQGAVRRVTLGTLSRRERKRLHLAAADHLERDEGGPERAAAVAGQLVAALEAEPAAEDAGRLRSRAATAWSRRA